MSGISIYDTQILVQAYNALPRETSFCLKTYRPVLAMILDSVWKLIWLLVFSLRETTPCNLNNYLPGWWGALNLSLCENKWCKGGAWMITGIKQHFERSLFGQHCNISELHHPLLHSDAALWLDRDMFIYQLQLALQWWSLLTAGTLIHVCSRKGDLWDS